MKYDHRTSMHYGGRKSRGSRGAVKGLGLLLGLAVWSCSSNKPVKQYVPTKFDNFCAIATIIFGITLIAIL